MPFTRLYSTNLARPIYRINYEQCKEIPQLREAEPLKKLVMELNQVKKRIPVLTLQADGAMARLTEVKSMVEQLNDQIKSSSEKALEYEKQAMDLKNKVEMDKKRLPSAIAQQQTLQVEVSEATSVLNNGREEVATLAEHHDTVKTILEERDTSLRPLGKSRGTTTHDLCNACDIEDAFEIEGMHIGTVERHFRFLNVLGVPNAYAYRNRGVDRMRYNLLLLLFPELQPDASPASPERPAENMRALAEAKDMEDKANEAKAAQDAMLARMIAQTSTLPATGTPSTNKRKLDNIFQKEDTHPHVNKRTKSNDIPKDPNTPMELALDSFKKLSSAERAVFAENFLASSSTRAQDSPLVIMKGGSNDGEDEMMGVENIGDGSTEEGEGDAGDEMETNKKNTPDETI